MALTKQKLEWIEYLIGGAEEKELSPENGEKAQQRREERQNLIAQGIVPVKPFDGGVVIGDQE